MKRECNYRNCNNDITEMRKNAKFCCRSCKDNEKKYIKRELQFIEKYSKKELEKVNNIKKLMFLIKGGTEI